VNRTMRAYLYHDTPDDPRQPHECTPSVAVSEAELKQIGVLYWHCSGPQAIDQVNAIAQDRHYQNRDEITITPEKLPNYEARIKQFFQEHIHEDEEIRYIVEGAGYFDVRDSRDRWVRIQVTAGDLIVLPAGIYHRFTLDTSDYIRTMRLFKDEPKWEAIPRPTADANTYRTQYLAQRIPSA
ncbi:1,2-dihydroxy-3-keto-5-methylthiopentene dioxygenase, partial [Dimargaris xerosporica]